MTQPNLCQNSMTFPEIPENFKFQKFHDFSMTVATLLTLQPSIVRTVEKRNKIDLCYFIFPPAKNWLICRSDILVISWPPPIHVQAKEVVRENLRSSPNGFGKHGWLFFTKETLLNSTTGPPACRLAIIIEMACVEVTLNDYRSDPSPCEKWLSLGVCLTCGALKQEPLRI